MKFASFIIMIFFIYSCNEQQEKVNYILRSSNQITITNDVVRYKNEFYTGVLFLLDANSKDTLISESYKDGLLDGISRKWYPNHRLMEIRAYTAGKKNGKQIAFWDNGKKRFEFVAIDDAYEGVLKEWSYQGNLFHLAHYVKGQEEGAQQMWYENGKIRANYVIVGGKRYGLLGTKNCKNVSDSIFVVK